MAFNKRTWKGRQGVGLNKFSINGATPVTVVNQPDSITEVGDALSAGNLNDLEDRIADAFDETASKEEVTNVKNACDEMSNPIEFTFPFDSIESEQGYTIGTNGNWTTEVVRSRSKLLPVKGYNIVEIQAQSNQGCVYAFLQDNVVTPEATPNYCDGEIRTSVQAGATVIRKVPSDANYLYTSEISSVGTTNHPQSVRYSLVAKVGESWSDIINDLPLYYGSINVTTGEIRLTGSPMHSEYIDLSDARAVLVKLNNTGSTIFYANIVEFNADDSFSKGLFKQSGSSSDFLAVLNPTKKYRIYAYKSVSGVTTITTKEEIANAISICPIKNASSFFDSIQEEIDNIKPIYKPVIFDADFTADVDDCVATRILCWALDNKMINLRGAVTDCYTSIVAPSLDVFLSNYGYPNIPMGWDKTKAVVRTSYFQTNMVAEGTPRFDTTDEYPDAIDIYRKELAKSPNKVSIIVTGYLVNVANLLKSSADGYSSLTGSQLVANKVDKIYIMGGNFPTGNNEGNFRRDLNDAIYVLENSPVPLVFLGYSQGVDILVGQNMKDIYTSYSEDMLYQAYYDYQQGTGRTIITDGRSAWDPMLAYLAIIGDAEMCGYRLYRGTCTVTPTGETAPEGETYYTSSFTYSENGNHYYVDRYKNDAYFVEQINSKIF